MKKIVLSTVVASSVVFASSTISCKPGEGVNKYQLKDMIEKDQDVTKVCTSNITDLSGLFFNSDFNQDISRWDVSNVKNFESLFGYNTQFNQDISSWNTSNAINMKGMFTHAGAFNQDISSWDVSNVENMIDMFSHAKDFDQDLSKWNVANVRDVYGMFANTKVAVPAYKFSSKAHDLSNIKTISCAKGQGVTRKELVKMIRAGEDITKVCTSNIKNMSWLFASLDYPFNQDISSWDTSSATTMKGMFSHAGEFNQDISGWDLSHVKDISFMFSHAKKFNQDIGKWNTKSLEKMNHFLGHAPAFNHDISMWNIDKVRFAEHECKAVTLDKKLRPKFIIKNDEDAKKAENKGH